jgi:hypothetical protein
MPEQNAAHWAAWAGEVNEALTNFEELGRVLLGGEDKEKDPGLLLDLTKQTYDNLREETAETVKVVSDALNARIEAEVAVLRDGFIERLDALLLNHSPKKLRAMETAIRKDMNERASDLDQRLDKLVASIDSCDKRRRYDRNTTRTERDQLAVARRDAVGGLRRRSTSLLRPSPILRDGPARRSPRRDPANAPWVGEAERAPPILLPPPGRSLYVREGLTRSRGFRRGLPPSGRRPLAGA